MLRFLRRLFSPPAGSDAGTRGENLACEWLQREQGFRLVIRNWRSPVDQREEIDLVFRDGDVLVFVEVKARAANALVPGYHAVDRRKKRALRRAIRAYLATLRPKMRTFRFDVVEVSFAEAGENGLEAEPQVLHFENVPLFTKYFRG